VSERGHAQFHKGVELRDFRENPSAEPLGRLSLAQIWADGLSGRKKYFFWERVHFAQGRKMSIFAQSLG
jgi:hypothetical protein